jgi:DHA2 family multidrug resistance protein
MPEPDRQTAPADLLGAALLGVALISFQVILTRGPIDDWFGSPVLVVLAWSAVIALVLFGFRSFDHPNPLLRLWMIKDRHVLASVLIGSLTGVILSGAIYALPEYLRGIDPQPRSASQTGEILCVYAITAACLRPLATVAIGRFGQRRVTVAALVSLIASMLLMSRFLTTGTPAIYYALPLVLYGVCIAPLLSAVGSGTAARVAGTAAQIDAVSIYMTFRQFGAALGVALVNLVITTRESLHSGRLFEHVQPGLATMDAWRGAMSRAMVEQGGRTGAEASTAALRLLQETSARQASVLAFADAFRVMAVIGVLALMFVPLMAPPARKA